MVTSKSEESRGRLNAQLGKNLKSKRTKRGRKDLRRVLAGLVVIGAIAVLLIVFVIPI